MGAIASFRRTFFGSPGSVLLIGCLVSFPHNVAAQADVADGTLRERIKQRILKARQDKSSSAPQAEARSSIDTPGDYSLSMVHDGLTRRYRVHVPLAYRAATPTPMILAFHGGGGDMTYMATDAYYGLISTSEAAGFIVVFPNGFSLLSSGKFAAWNAGTCCATARDKDIDDVGFIKAVVSHLRSQLNVAPDRIYATGMSNGGMMSYRLACEMATTFKAIAAVAGTDNTTSCSPKVPISILHIHARNDDHVLYNGGAGKNAFRDQTKISDFISVPATIAQWVERNGCHAPPQRVLETSGAYCERYTQCRGNVAVQLCVTERGGHSWPGGSKPRGDEPPSQALSANDIMWTFFNTVADQSATSISPPAPLP